MSWNKINIRKVIFPPISGEWGEDGNEVNVLRTTNFTNDGSLNLLDVVKRNIPKHKVQQKKLEVGDTILEKSGGSPSQPVGRVVYFNLKNGEPYLCNNFTSIIRPKKDVDSKYLFWFMFFNHVTKKTLSYQNKTTGILNLKTERYLDELEIPFPSIQVQKKISLIIDKADELRKNDRKLFIKHDELLQSIFHDLFGDPVRNEKKWETKNLGELCNDFKYGTNQKSFELQADGAIPIIRIPNVLNSAVNYDDLKYSIISEKEYKEIKLEKGDLLFVRTNGNPAYIGRCAVFNDSTIAGYASYLIRTRVKDKTIVLPEFLQTTITFKTYRSLVLKKATTTAGNYNINTVALKSLPICLPPIALQNKFLAISQNINKQKQQVREQMEQSENLFQSLLQRAFKGELAK